MTDAARRGRGAVPVATADQLKLVSTDPRADDGVEISLGGLAAWHGQDKYLPASDDAGAVTAHNAKILVEELHSQSPLPEDFNDLLHGDRIYQTVSLLVPQLNKVNPRTAQLVGRDSAGPDANGRNPTDLQYLGQPGKWIVWASPDGKARAQAPSINGGKGLYFEIAGSKSVNFGNAMLVEIDTVPPTLVLFQSHKKRPPEHASAPGTTPIRLGGKMCTYIAFGPVPDGEDAFEPTEGREYYIDVPKESPAAEWDVPSKWAAIYQNLQDADAGGPGGDDAGADEDGNPLEPSEQHDFVIIDGQTYTREKRGKDMVNVIACSFTVLEIKRILAFNDRSQPPHYTIVCAIKLNPNAPIPVARLKLGEDMAAVNEARVQVLEVETDIVLSSITTQASLNSMLSKFHPRLVWHRRDGSAFVSLIMQQDKPATTIACSTIGRQLHDPMLWILGNTAIRIDPGTFSFTYPDLDEIGIKFIPSIFLNPEGPNAVPLTPGLIPDVLRLPREFGWLAYMLDWSFWNRIMPTVYGKNAGMFKFNFCMGVFGAQHFVAFGEGRGKKSKGAGYPFIWSEDPNTAKTANILDIMAQFGMFDCASGEVTGTGSAMKRILSYFIDLPIGFDDVVLGQEGSQSGQRMAFLMGQFARFVYDAVVRLVCGANIRATSMPMLTSNQQAGANDPAAQTRTLMLNAGVANSPGEIIDLHMWRKIMSATLPYKLLMCNNLGQPPKLAIIDTTRAFVKATGIEARQMEIWATPCPWFCNWNILMQGSFDQNWQALNWATQELAHICHLSKVNTILERFIIETHRVVKSKGWNQPNPENCIGIHNFIAETSPNPLATGEAAKAWSAFNFTQIFRVLSKCGQSIDSAQLARHVKDIARAAGNAIIVIKGHTAGNGSLAYFYEIGVQSDGTQNPFPPAKTIADDVQAEDVMMHGAGRSMQVPLSYQEALDGGFMVQQSTLYIKNAFITSVIAQATEGCNSVVSLEGVRITSALLGGRQGVLFKDLICPEGDSPYYDMAKAHPYAAFGGITGELNLGDPTDRSDTPSVVTSANEANFEHNGLHVAEQFSAGEIHKLLAGGNWAEEDYLANLPPAVKECPFHYSLFEGCDYPPFFKQIYDPDEVDEDERSSGYERDSATEVSGSNLAGGADLSGDDRAVSMPPITVPDSLPQLPPHEAEANGCILSAQVRQRTGDSPYSGPNSDEEAMADEMMFGAPLGPMPPSAPPSPPGSPASLSPPGTPPPTEGEERLPFFSMAKENLDPNTRTPEPQMARPTPLAPRKPLAPLPIGGDTDVPFIEWVCAEASPDGTLRPVPDDRWASLRIPAALESIFSRMSITSTHVSMDANAVQHGPAANGVGPRTPFSQAAMCTETERFTTDEVLKLNCELKEDAAADEYLKQLEESGYMCGACGGNPEECGGTTFCIHFSCKNEDELGFRCERRAIEGEDLCAGCKAGGEAYFSEPIAPGVMLHSELIDYLEEEDLAEVERERKKAKFPNHLADGVRFAPVLKPTVKPLMSTTFGAFSGSFSFPPLPPPPTPITITSDSEDDPVRPTSPMHNLPEAKEYSLFGRSPDLAKDFSLAPGPSAAHLRALALEKELKTSADVDMALNYAPCAEPRVEGYSKREGKRKAKFSGSIHLRAADNNSGARSPYAEGDVCIWMVLDGSSIQTLSNLFGQRSGMILMRDSFHRATASFISNMRNGSEVEYIAYSGLGSVDLAGLYQIWSTLASTAFENTALKHIIVYASTELRDEFVQDRWQGMLPSAIGAQSIIVQEDLYPELFIVENTFHIRADINSSVDLLQTVPVSRFHNPILGAAGPAIEPLFDLQLPPVLDRIPSAEIAEQELLEWLEGPGAADPPPVQRQNATGPQPHVINAAEALAALSTVPVCEGRKLDYLSDNFRSDAQQFHALPMAVEVVEVPSSLVERKGRMDPLGMLGMATVAADLYPPYHDPVHPDRSEIQVAQLYEPPEPEPFSTPDKFNIMYLENRAPEDATDTVMAIYDKFRKGTAEPEQVSYMLEQVHSLFTKPHRNKTYAEEYMAAQGQINNLSRENKRLRDDNDALEREFREYKIRAEASQVPEEDLYPPPGFLRASPTPSEMLFSRTPSPKRAGPSRDPRSRSPPPMGGY